MRKLVNLTIIDLDDHHGIGQLTNKIVFVDDSISSSTFCENEGSYSTVAAVIHIQTDFPECARSSFGFPVFILRDYADDSSKEPSKTAAESLKDQLKTAGTASIYEHAPTAENYQMSLADYSSKGPSPLGLCKPDVVVPGYATSSSARRKELTTDSLSVKWGTSMATPAAAGSCAIIRQFFTDGFYPGMTKNSTNSFVPASYLIRAVIVNSAKPFQSPKYGPNIETGFGAPNLSASLMSPLRIVKKQGILANSKHRYELNLIAKNDSLRVTMAYIDPPLSLSSPVPLFADLDLVVISPSGKTYVGNQLEDGQTEMANTIERVIVDSEKVEVGKYVILVMSNNFTDPELDTINYSIAINGPFDHFDFLANSADVEPQIRTKRRIVRK